MAVTRVTGGTMVRAYGIVTTFGMAANVEIFFIIVAVKPSTFVHVEAVVTIAGKATITKAAALNACRELVTILIGFANVFGLLLFTNDVFILEWRRGTITR